MGNALKDEKKQERKGKRDETAARILRGAANKGPLILFPSTSQFGHNLPPATATACCKKRGKKKERKKIAIEFRYWRESESKFTEKRTSPSNWPQSSFSSTLKMMQLCNWL